MGGNTKGFWSGDLGYRQAAAAAAGVVAAGWGLQFARGGGAIIPPSWPSNAVFLALFLGWLALLSRSEGRLVAWLGGVPFALVSMLGVGLLGVAGGVIPQAPAQSPEWARALGLDHVFSGAPFAVALLLLLTNLGLATRRRMRQHGPKAWFFSLNHAGLWIVIASAMLGSGDMIRARMILVEGQAEAMVVDAAGRQGYLPFGLFLQRFYVEQYPEETGRPGAPKRFAAEVTVLRHNQRFEDVAIEVNKPLRRDGWTLYLTNYDLSPNGQTNQCLIEAVRDPWLPAVYTGIFLMLGGAVAMLFRNPFAPCLQP
jgi:cytochrome c biogenesis factor